MMKIYRVILTLAPLLFSSQYNNMNNSQLSNDDTASGKKSTTQKVETIGSSNLLIPQKIGSKFGYVNQDKKIIIPHEYYIAMFFAEDCNLLNSPNTHVRKFGTSSFATVEKNHISYRIDEKGKKVYQYKNADLGKCNNLYKKGLFHAYVLNGLYGVIEDAKFENPNDSKQFKIYPKYEYLFILEGTDPTQPMIIASKDNKFGIIDVNGKVIIPFEYRDIKRNYSWKLGKMFEVTKDDKNYYYIDIANKSY